MSKNSKKIVFKTAILLLMLFTAVTFTFTATYSRYITESEHSIGFLAKKQPQILLDGVEVANRTLISVSNWAQGVEQINGKFTLNAKNLSEDEKLNFYIRAFIVKEEETENTETVDDTELLETAEQQAAAPVTEITLVSQEKVYPSSCFEVNPEAEFNIKNNKQGEAYFFFDSVDAAPQPSEQIFTLTGESEQALDLEINVYNSEIKSENVYICIEIIK